MLRPDTVVQTMSRIGLLLLLVLMPVACTSQDDQPRGETTAGQESEPPAEDAVVQVSRDLAHYPMPSSLTGSSHTPGAISSLPHDPAKGAIGALVFATIADTLKVTVCGVNTNCCTERMATSYVAIDAGADVGLYEYLPDVCECFQVRDVTFNVFPALASGSTVRVFHNGRTTALASGMIP